MKLFGRFWNNGTISAQERKVIAAMNTEKPGTEKMEVTETKLDPSQVPLYLFHSGKNRRVYEYMGVHKATRNGKKCMVARV